MPARGPPPSSTPLEHNWMSCSRTPQRPRRPRERGKENGPAVQVLTARSIAAVPPSAPLPRTTGRTSGGRLHVAMRVPARPKSKCRMHVPGRTRYRSRRSVTSVWMLCSSGPFGKHSRDGSTRLRRDCTRWHRRLNRAMQHLRLRGRYSPAALGTDGGMTRTHGSAVQSDVLSRMLAVREGNRGLFPPLRGTS
jgi:hypothetical protein